jgi:HPr kinase/phosphorylase
MNLHGVFLEILGKGVLLTGKSGSGKSESAFALLERGHRLIADDAPSFYKKEEKVIGFCPERLQDLLSIRSLGIIDVRQLWGKEAVLSGKSLDLIIELSQDGTAEPLPLQFYEKLEIKIILDTPIKYCRISIQFTSQLAIIIENAVRLAFLKPSLLIERLLQPCV